MMEELANLILEWMKLNGSTTPKDISEGYAVRLDPRPTKKQALQALQSLRDAGHVVYVRADWCWYTTTQMV